MDRSEFQDRVAHDFDVRFILVQILRSYMDYFNDFSSYIMTRDDDIVERLRASSLDACFFYVALCTHLGINFEDVESGDPAGQEVVNHMVDHVSRHVELGDDIDIDMVSEAIGTMHESFMTAFTSMGLFDEAEVFEACLDRFESGIPESLDIMEEEKSVKRFSKSGDYLN